ncbi:MAG TPA: hypothetical protein VL122_03070 [Nitrospirota bacterium]|nr:hypothetical protein [Nitrospirota bacterium]
MKQTLFILAIALALGISAATATAQQQGSQGAVVMPGAKYNPNIVYAGNFQADLLFSKYEGSDTWRRVKKLDRLRYVTCTDALQNLRQQGTWKGHLDVKDGSCGSPGEPLDWAMGNWINYNDQVLQVQNNSGGK